jgi:outer membrane protein assembly factor BamD (BamD/ComL family)
MSVIGIASSLFSQFQALAAQSKSGQLTQSFQQLSQDLQSGNLAQAQNDFSSLQQLLPGSQQNSLLASAATTTGSNPLATAVSQLAQDIKSGNATAAQTDLSNVQQDVQQLRQHGAGHAHHHHHRHSESDSSQSPSNPTPFSTLFGQLGQSLQAGNLAAAQQAYASLQQDFQQFGLGASATPASNSASSNLTVSA